MVASADDCSSEKGSETAHSLFGLLLYLDGRFVLCCLVLLVATVLFIEKLFDILKKLTSDSSFDEIVERIQKELMIVGCTAFLFKVVINNIGSIDEMWFESIEFAGLALYIHVLYLRDE